MGALGDGQIVEQLERAGRLVVRIELELAERRVGENACEIETRQSFERLSGVDPQPEVLIRKPGDQRTLVRPQAVDAKAHFVNER